MERHKPPTEHDLAAMTQTANAQRSTCLSAHDVGSEVWAIHLTEWLRCIKEIERLQAENKRKMTKTIHTTTHFSIDPGSLQEVINGCQLELDRRRGVLYVHGPMGVTIVRIQGLISLSSVMDEDGKPTRMIDLRLSKKQSTHATR